MLGPIPQPISMTPGHFGVGHPNQRHVHRVQHRGASRSPCPVPFRNVQQHARNPSPQVRREMVSPPIVMVEHGLPAFGQQEPAASSGSKQSQSFHAGQEIVLGGRRFRCISPLGKGSYGEVWNCRTCDDPGRYGDSVALKEVLCDGPKGIDQAMYEVHVMRELDNIQRDRILQANQPPLRVPACIASELYPLSNGRARVRFMMTRLPGEPLDVWLADKKQLAAGRSEAFKKGCYAAAQLLQDLVPTFLALSSFCLHRDVNSHNVLVHDRREEGAGLSFWLIDFGLAVDMRKWNDPRGNVREGGEWKTADIAGDCRYWPSGAWMMYLFGWKYLSGHPNFCKQYQTRLDIHGLGITALELLCKPALAAPGVDAVSQGMLPLLSAWQAYEESVHSWWSRLYDAFQKGQDVTALQSTFLREHVPENLNHRLDNLRRACHETARVVDDSVVSSILPMLAEMISEASALGWNDLYAVFCNEGQVGPKVPIRGQAAPQRTITHRRMRTVDNSIPVAQLAQPVVGTGSYVPEPSPPMVEVVQVGKASYVPPVDSGPGPGEVVSGASPAITYAYGETYRPPAPFPHSVSQASFGGYQPPHQPSFMPPPLLGQPQEQPRSYVPPVVQRSGSFVPPVQQTGSFVPPVVPTHQVPVQCVPVNHYRDPGPTMRRSPQDRGPQPGNATPVPPGWAQIQQQIEQENHVQYNQDRRRERSRPPPPQMLPGKGPPLMANAHVRSPSFDRFGGQGVAAPFPVDEYVRNVPRPASRLHA